MIDSTLSELAAEIDKRMENRDALLRVNAIQLSAQYARHVADLLDFVARFEPGMEFCKTRTAD
jgi:hypothetical protein